MRMLSKKDWLRAGDLVDPNLLPLTSPGEVWTVLDAEANGDDPDEHLQEHRFWRSPAGRQQERDELFESGHPMGDEL